MQHCFLYIYIIYIYISENKTIEQNKSLSSCTLVHLHYILLNNNSVLVDKRTISYSNISKRVCSSSTKLSQSYPSSIYIYIYIMTNVPSNNFFIPQCVDNDNYFISFLLCIFPMFVLLSFFAYSSFLFLSQDFVACQVI